ncbi:hypothetical protein CIK05_01965 [Bdellovibrio sp. qaytius]|nr:hypothetical protein CIK05_01965 [Bdellovibrio sp. qaytius]
MKKLLLILLSLTAVNVAQAKKHTAPAAAKRPLVLWLHGCLQSPEDFIAMSKITELTQEENPVILAPEQSIFANPVKCWNWFLPSLQDRKDFMASIVGDIDKLVKSGEVDENKIYVGGFSAGAVLATHFALCYPEVFRGALLHSGAPFKFVQNFFGLGDDEDLVRAGYECADHDKPAKLNSVTIFSGTSDIISSPSDNKLVLKQMLGFYDLLDDQTLNDSAVDSVTISTTDRVQDKITDYVMKTGQHVRFVAIKGMRHQWSGGASGMIATSPDTLSAVEAFLQWTENFTN